MKRVKTYKIKSKPEAQAMSNFLFHEMLRHSKDITDIIKDIGKLKDQYNVTPNVEIDYIEI